MPQIIEEYKTRMREIRRGENEESRLQAIQAQWLGHDIRAVKSCWQYREKLQTIRKKRRKGKKNINELIIG